MREHVVSRMRSDTLTSIAASDSMILKLRSVLLQKLGQWRALDISARMRELARVLIRMNKSGKTSLVDCISDSCYDTVMQAVEAEGGSYVHETGRCVRSLCLSLEI